jgi:hypoxanthine phosphoribosyltransferase
MKLLISADEIAGKIDTLAQEINREYESKSLYILVLLKGAFIFAADLVRKITIPFKIDFIRVSTYGNSHLPGTKPTTTMESFKTDIKGKDVLFIDDIIDTGNTFEYLVKESSRYDCNSVKLCALLDKPSRREADINPDYYGFKIDDGFVVGYGLDYAEKYRGLPGIYVLSDEEI